MKILIVEDEIEILNFLKNSLKAELFTVDTTDDGKVGLNLALTNQYDIIILDNILPSLNGIDICKEIRSSKKYVPIIMLSVKTEINTKITLLNAGADDYLTKPFSFDELIARIRALLRRGEKIKSDIIEIANLVLDSKRHTVKFNKKNISLTRKEYQLLEYLMRNNGIALSRGMILEHVWDVNADPFSNTIESHIGSLRRKIEVFTNKKIIQTVPGVGYKIIQKDS